MTLVGVELLLGCDDVFVRLDEIELDAEDFDATEELADEALERVDWLVLVWELLAELLVVEDFEELLV